VRGVSEVPLGDIGANGKQLSIIFKPFSRIALRVLKMQVIESGAQPPALQVPSAEIVSLQFGLATSKEFVRISTALHSAMNLSTHFLSLLLL